MIEALSLSRMRIPIDRILIAALMVLLTCSTLAVVALLASNRIQFLVAIFFAALPWVLLAAAFRPDWLLLGFFALPATHTAVLETKRLLVLIGVALVMLLVTRRRFSLGWGTGLGALLTINIAGYLFHAQVEPDALAGSQALMLNLTLYILLALLAFNLAILGELDGERLATALVIGVLTTLVVAYAGYGGVWHASGPSILTNLGMSAVAALGVTQARLFMAGGARGRHPVNYLMTGIFLALTIASGSRATWIAAAITVGVLAFRLGRRGYVLLLAIAITLALLAPTVRQGISRSESGDIVAELRSGEITTGRWELWNQLWDRALPALPWGHGFGYTRSLSSEELFGQSGSFHSDESGFVPPHNDYMFMLAEFGVPGVLLLAIFWFAVLRARRLVSESTDPLLRRSSWLFLGVIVSGLTFSFFDDLFFVRPLAQRCFPILGFIFGLAVVERARRRKLARMESPETTEETAPALLP